MNPPPIVLDTNVVLDLFVFDDEASLPLKSALAAGHLRWLCSQSMRDELERVLGYPHIVRRMGKADIAPVQVLAAFDAHVATVDEAPKASVTCKDPDDQKFIDLAVAHRAELLSKDNAVLCMRKRLEALGVVSGPLWSGAGSGDA